MSPAVEQSKSRREAQKESRPGEIVDAALTVFARDGFAGARLDDVADAAGISKGTIYLYFDTKEELFKACVRETLGKHLQDTRDMAATFEGDSADLLRMMVAGFGNRLAKGDFRTILLMLISEGKRFPELLTFYYQEIIGSGLPLLKGVIQRGVERGEFKPSGLDEFPMLLMSPVMMSVIWNHLFSSNLEIDVSAAINAHLDVVLDGLRVTQAP